MRSQLISLLNDLEAVYSSSEIKEYCLENNHEWFYSLILTNMKKRRPLILGFNWGASKDYKYKPQSSIDRTNFSEQDTGSLKRIYKYCRKYFGEDFLEEISQSNFCFFRSENESQISSEDINRCKPIFLQMIEIIEPSVILCFSRKLKNFMLSSDMLESMDIKKIKFRKGTSHVTYEASKGYLKMGPRIYFLPHPNYPMPGREREAAWEFCCGNKE